MNNFIVRFFILLMFFVFGCTISKASIVSKQGVVNAILGNKVNTVPNNIKNIGNGKAFVNIALCKYWGKRDEILHLPYNSSISITLPYKTQTKIRFNLQETKDLIFLNDKQLKPDNEFAKRTTKFLDLFRPKGKHFVIETWNDLPTASGLASSASGAAALVFALDELFDWNLKKKDLSILARIGSGSASRSIYTGIVEWDAGVRLDGMDSYAKKLKIKPIDSLRIGLLITTQRTKKTSSRKGMAQSVATSPYYNQWLKIVNEDLSKIKHCLESQDFNCIGQISESNALAMHAVSITSSPANLYWNSKTVDIFHKVWQLRKRGVPVYFTIDAGAHVKLIFTKNYSRIIQKTFPEVMITKIVW